MQAYNSFWLWWWWCTCIDDIFCSRSAFPSWHTGYSYRTWCCWSFSLSFCYFSQSPPLLISRRWHGCVSCWLQSARRNRHRWASSSWMPYIVVSCRRSLKILILLSWIEVGTDFSIRPNSIPIPDSAGQHTRYDDRVWNLEGTELSSHFFYYCE